VALITIESVTIALFWLLLPPEVGGNRHDLIIIIAVTVPMANKKGFVSVIPRAGLLLWDWYVRKLNSTPVFTDALGTGKY